MIAGAGSVPPPDAHPVPATTAVVLAAGRGSRMRANAAAVSLPGAQARAAEAGHKAMMPFDRPFLDYVLASLADAGLTRICIVCAPGDDALRTRYAGARGGRARVEVTTQHEPKGTADAVLAGARAVGNETFLVVNGDNLYPVAALRAVAALGGNGLAGFTRDGLIARGDIPPERLAAFALIRVKDRDELADIVEKPDAGAAREFGAGALVSMNLWSFAPSIADACARVRPSSRGELELADAVRVAMREFGAVFRVVRSDDAVLDLSARADVPRVAARLRGLSAAW